MQSHFLITLSTYIRSVKAIHNYFVGNVLFQFVFTVNVNFISDFLQQFEPVIKALESGQDVDLSKLPPPPNQTSGAQLSFYWHLVPCRY